MFKKILTLLVLTVSCMLADNSKILNYYNQLLQLSAQQKSVLLEVYYYADKNGSLGAELSTIAWKESNFGEWKYNIADGKYGSASIFHIRLDYSFIRNNLTTDWKRSRHVEQLLESFKYAADEAISIYKTFYSKTKTKNKTLETFAMYNGGYKGFTNKKSKDYAEDAMLRMKAIQMFISNIEQDLFIEYDLFNIRFASNE